MVRSNDPALAPGDRVESMFGWRDALVAPVGAFQKLPASNAPLQTYLGVLGMPGLTAYSGLLNIGEPKAGDTVFVSGAAGAVGSVVAQIAKLKGCDHVINYKTCGSLLEAVRKAAPGGVDIYFDNVGGEHLQVALEVAKPFARFAECGMISMYNDTAPTPGPTNMAYIVGKSIKIQGFIVSNHWGQRPQFLADMTQWIADGKIASEETVEIGIENAPKAFMNLFSGANTGKMLVKLG